MVFLWRQAHISFVVKYKLVQPYSGEATEASFGVLCRSCAFDTEGKSTCFKTFSLACIHVWLFQIQRAIAVSLVFVVSQRLSIVRAWYACLSGGSHTTRSSGAFFLQICGYPGDDGVIIAFNTTDAVVEKMLGNIRDVAPIISRDAEFVQHPSGRPGKIDEPMSALYALGDWTTEPDVLRICHVHHLPREQSVAE